MSFSDKLYKLRISKGISQKELAEGLGVAQSSINYWEKGQRDPSITVVKKIAEYFCVSIDYLMGISDKEERLCDLTTFTDEIDSYTQELGEFLYYNPKHKELFDASMEVKPKDVEFATEMLNRINGKNKAILESMEEVRENSKPKDLKFPDQEDQE